MMADTPEHATERIWQRSNFPVDTERLRRMLRRAAARGLYWKEATGKLREHLDQRMGNHEKGRNAICYGSNIIVFFGKFPAPENLVTVLEIPHYLQQAALRQVRKKAERKGYT